MFDTDGSPTTIPPALLSVKPGGTTAVAGVHAAKLGAPIPAGALVIQDQRLLGSFAGSMQPQIDLPKLVGLYWAGRLQLEEMITKHYAVDNLMQAFGDMETSTVARGVIPFD